jgi:hypothetical protein
MPTFALNRRFIRWDSEDASAVDMHVMFGSDRSSYDWSQVLEHHRVVILAEAGSGKTEELRERARLLTESQKFAFYATVQDVGRDGLDLALSSAHRSRLADWRRSDQAGWFFVDSVDEARLDNIRLETALRKLADGIEAAPRRAHVVLSSRITDWQFRADLDKLSTYLPVPAEPSALPPPSPQNLLSQALRGELRRDRPKVPAEVPLVVAMAPLDAGRIRLFATGKGISGIDTFMAALDDANLRSLARRPLDLDWLVTYWRSHGRLGSLAEMLDYSFRERLRETNPAYAPSDPINVERAILGMERIGAALVFGRADTIAIPDPELIADDGNEFDLEKILPDWSPQHRGRLLTRPAFDPATFGRVRLHNDNTGQVRSYLAARWLKRRQDQNCPINDLLDLLFAESYGLQLVKPSVSETAAWLAIWNRDVAREVLKREPALLLGNGDPASLPLPTRAAALQRMVEDLLAQGDRYVVLDEDSLKRFSTSDLVPQIRDLWRQHKDDSEVRELLLRMIWLGRLRNCADLATEALFGPYTDHLTLVFAGRVVGAIGESADKELFAAKVRAEADRLPGQIFWDALDQLFPKLVSVPELLSILSSIGADVRDETLGLRYHGPRLSERVTGRADLEVLLHGLLDQLGPTRREFEQTESPRERAYYPMIAATAHQLLEVAGADEAPLLALDAALRLGEGHRYRPTDEEAQGLKAAILRSPERRRAAFWRAAELFATHPMLDSRGLQDSSDLAFVGWSPGLSVADVDWLFEDVAGRPTEAQRRLACAALMEIWHQGGRDRHLLSRIVVYAGGHPGLKEVCDRWLAAREPTAEEQRYQDELARRVREQDEQQAERDGSWQNFLAKLRADPGVLTRQPPPTRDRVDGHLFNLWELLTSTDGGRNRYAIDNVRPLEPILGEEVTDAFRQALTAFWRQWEPTLPSARPPDQRNRMSKIDCMGIAGVSVEAKQTPTWPTALTSSDAYRAAQYAMLEINGFPAWLIPLARCFPAEVRAVLMTEIEADIQNTAPGPRAGPLEYATRAAPEIVQCIAVPLFDLLVAQANFPRPSLGPTLTVIVQAQIRNAELASLAISRFTSATDLTVAAAYLGAAFQIDPDQALTALLNRLAAIAEGEQTVLVQAVLPDLFDTSFTRRDVEPPTVPFKVLEQLVNIVFSTIRVEDDNRHDDGKAFSPDMRDAAESARGYLFNLLSNTPGRATFESLNRLAQMPGFPIPPKRMEALAFKRAAEDAEHSPWPPGDAYAMEQVFDAAPRTPAELQCVALRRLADLQHSLHHDDFAQGRTLKLLPDEQAVQNWVADQLRSRQRRAYSLEREPHVVDEKEPDIRMRAPTTDASVPIEIKVAESWTLPELEAALTDQLIGRYLRAYNASDGILLLVHQKPRPRGWQAPDEDWWSFPEVVAHLRGMADTIAATGPDAPQCRIAVLDVSSL